VLIEFSGEMTVESVDAGVLSSPLGENVGWCGNFKSTVWWRDGMQL
jgi:hypothetical protein